MHMKLHNFIPNRLPEHTKIRRIHITVKIDKNQLDLQQVYDNIVVSTNGIQVCKYLKNVKNSTIMSSENRSMLECYNIYKTTFEELVIHFDNLRCVVMPHGMIKFSLDVTSKDVDKYTNVIMGLLDNPSVVSQWISGIIFKLKIVNDCGDLLSESLLKTPCVGVPKGRFKLMTFRNHFSFWITNHSILGTANSFDALDEFVTFLENYVKFDDDRMITEDDIMNNDDIYLEITI